MAGGALETPMKTAVGLFWLIVITESRKKMTPPTTPLLESARLEHLSSGGNLFFVGLNGSYQTPDKTNMGMHIACVNPQNAFKL